MRIKKEFSFDEEKDAERILLQGFPNGQINYSDIYLIAKYFRRTFGYGVIRLEKELIRFCQSQDSNFNPVIEADTIKKWVSSAMNYDLRKIDSVSLSQKEIDFLKTISIPRDRKILFMTLVLSKALKKRSTRYKKTALKTSDKHYVRYSNFTDIIRLANVNITETALADIYYKYPRCFTFYRPEKELIRLEYVDNSPQEAMVIDNMSKIGYYYDFLFGKTDVLVFCERCGTEMVKKSNSHKYCDNCAIEIRREKQKNLMRKRRYNWTKKV